jgi:GNAT superfamily N-acetyltransferase
MAGGAFSLSELENRYPKTNDCQGTDIQFTLMDKLDSAAVKAFTDQLPEHDLLFLSRDLREPKVVEAWSRNLASGDIVSVAAMRQDEIVGTSAIVVDKHSWSAHVGEMRVLLSPDARELGLGRALIQEAFLMGLDLGLEKLTVRLTLDQDRAITVFEEMGFKTEAHLRDQVKDSNGDKHDLLIMSHDAQRVRSMLQAYGVDEAV